MISNDFVPKNPLKFSCEKCDYTTSNKKDYTKHINTNKHKINEIQGFSIETPQKSPKIPNHECSCGKIYKDNSGLWRHKKICTFIDKSDNNQKDEKKDEKNDELINYLIKENQDFKNLILEIVKKDTINNSNNNNTNTNSHNKAFNLQFFLNETCKDAMNIMDFVDSIKIQLSDLEKFEEIGYVEGISKIIVKNLNSLDENMRPVHCTDTKREVMYVKDENKWEKENDNKQKLRKFIKHVTHKNTKLLKDFKLKHPDCEKSDSKYSDQYNRLIIEAFGGKGNNDEEKENKIIKNISKNVIIDK